MATVRNIAFELEGADAAPLRGEVRTGTAREGGPAVVICHGFKGFKDWGFFPHLATRLARAGMTAVSFNFSGSGIGADGESFSEPERFGHATFSNDLADLGRVIAALVSGALAENLAPPRTLGLFGHSRGGAAAILFAADHRNCGCLVTWAAIADTMRWDSGTIQRWRADGKLDVVNTRTGDVLPLYTDVLDDLEAHGSVQLNIERAARALAVPWLIVHGDADESVPVTDAIRLHKAAENAVTELIVIEGGSHTFGARHPWGGSTPPLNEAMDLSVAWFSRHLL
jgi:pimeloyl-ACP methyl ester carboxylesterase